jgi:Tfp pilus assembly protein PilF
VQTAHARPDEPPAAATPTKESTSADPASRDRSRAAFRKGVAQLRAQDWAGARASFEEAWSLVQHPSILLNLGIARLRTDEPVLAEQDLVRFLSEDPGAAAEEIASARDALAEARSKIGTLRVVASPASARVTVDGKAVAVRGTAGTQGGVAEVRLKAGLGRS